MRDLVRELKSQAYATAQRDGCEVEATPEWQAARELEAWREVMPQHEYRDGAIYRRPESVRHTGLSH